MAILHLMVGLPCSGKTTFAKQLAVREKALLLTPDVWQMKLFGQDFPGKYHDKRHSTIEEIMWDVAKSVLSLGTSVILDFGCWAQCEREEFRQRARELNVSFQIHYMSASKEELLARLAERNRQAAEDNEIWHIPSAYLEQWYEQFEPPTAEELNEV
jgi:predicted kinase